MQFSAGCAKRADVGRWWRNTPASTMLAAGWSTICVRSFQRGWGKEDGPNEQLSLNYLPTMGIAKGKLEHAFWQLSASHPPPPSWTLQECCELMDEAWWEQERGVCVWERDWELWCDSGQCVKKRDGAIVFLLFSRNVFKINIDSPIWCDLGLRCLSQVHNGHRVHESLHLLFESTAFGFPAQIFNHYDSTTPR